MLQPNPGDCFAARRRALMDAVGPAAVVVVRSLPERVRNGDAAYRFRQHSDVLYLTGFAEPEVTVVLRPGAATERFVMFVRPRDPEREIWDGRRAGLEGARAQYGADVAYPAAELATRLPELIANVDELHYAVGLDEDADALVMRTVARLRKTEKRGQRPPRAIVDPRAALHELRLHKDETELHHLRRAAAITADAHRAAMAQGRPGTFEYELEATVDYGFRSRGGSGPGYTTIVGAGENATILHYVENECAIADGDLVLIDAGCEYRGYTADVTRTWPASGRFTEPQRRIYQLVLDVQQAVIAQVAPGVTLDALHQVAVRGLTAGMIELGLLAGTVDERVADGSYKRFYMHLTSHWLGLDVHDAGAYTVAGGQARPLAPGMVITVEPGLYVGVDADAPPEYRGIGVRIEDDILVTTDGHENLTAACPKDVEAIEAACTATPPSS
ncbi:MAG: Xaa-Pro aminopeptidase [Kofleriaceae bacterium]